MRLFLDLHRLIIVCIATLGCVCVLQSTRNPWFSVPVRTGELATLAKHLKGVEPVCTDYFQWGMLVGLAVLLLTTIVARGRPHASVLICSTLLAGCLAYPLATMFLDASLMADAVWLQIQFDNLIWLGGDINLSSENGDAFWGNKIYSNDVPRQIKVVNMPAAGTWTPKLNQAADVVQWLGYGEPFCQFAKRGWTFAVLGWTLLTFATFQTRGEIQLSRIAVSVAWVASCCMFVALGAWWAILSAATAVEDGMRWTHVREYAKALEALEAACVRMPMLRQDTYYIAQRGLLESCLGLKTEYSLLFQAVGRERRGQYDAAFDDLQSLIDSADPAIAREALRGIQRFAVHDFNTGRTELATQRFQLVLSRQPSNFKVIYLLQICFLRQNRLPEVEAMSDWMESATSQLSFHSKRIFLATTERNAAIAASITGDAQRAWIHSIKAKNP